MSCPSCFKIPFVNCCHVRLSLFLLIYQLGADCHRRWIMLQVDGMAGNPTTSLFLMRRLMGYQLSGETWISSGQNWPESCQGGTYTRIGSTFEDKRGWWTRMDSGSPQKKILIHHHQIANVVSCVLSVPNWKNVDKKGRGGLSACPDGLGQLLGKNLLDFGGSKLGLWRLIF